MTCHRAAPRRRRSLPALARLPALVGCSGDGTPDAPGPAADFAGLEDGWNTVPVNGEAMCSDGSPYRFFVRPADPEKLLVYLEGGGACWTGGTCDRDLQPTYVVNLQDRHPSRADGILNFDNPANPFADYTVVYAPYCSGDVHLGAADVTYQAPATDDHPAHDVDIRHRGIDNVGAVLEWTAAHVFRPQELFVTGSSAGAIPSPVYATLLARAYPEARLTQLGDGAGGYRGIDDEARPQDRWGTLDWLADDPVFRDVDEENFSFEALYVAAARAHPDATFARYDTAEDSVQLQFLEIGGQPAESLLPLLRENQAEIEAQVGNVRSFVAGGGVHTILLRPQFYTFRVNDVTVRDWVAGLAGGTPVKDVACGDCAVAEETPQTPMDGDVDGNQDR